MKNINGTYSDQALFLKLIAAPFIGLAAIVAVAWVVALAAAAILGPFILLGWLFG